MSKTSIFLDKIILSEQSVCNMQIVYIDIEKYSKRRPQKQLEIIDAFTKLIEDSLTETAKKYINYFQENNINFRKDIIILPTGDGVAIGFPFYSLGELHLFFSSHLLSSLFIQNTENPCVDFSRDGYCNCHRKFNLRIGLAEGRLILYKDINHDYNMAGTPINMASRVMNFAERNQIILTEEANRQIIEWSKDAKIDTNFREYNNVEIKHGFRISLHQYINKDCLGLNTEVIKQLEGNIVNDLSIENPTSVLSRKQSLVEIDKTKQIGPDLSANRADAYLSNELLEHMVKIPSGDFILTDRNLKKINISLTESFSISSFPITQSIYFFVTNQNPSIFKGDDLPVENISWFDSVHFCNQLSKIFGLDEVYCFNGNSVSIIYSKNGFRLPTEAEWEYACLGGASVDSLIDVDEYGWYSKNSQKQTHPVCQKKANKYGIYDMLGNVWEWCNDWYEKESFAISQFDPIGAASGIEKVIRGGSWMNMKENLMPNYRNRANPDSHNSCLGFRVVCKTV